MRTGLADRGSPAQNGAVFIILHRNIARFRPPAARLLERQPLAVVAAQQVSHLHVGCPMSPLVPDPARVLGRGQDHLAAGPHLYLTN